jgi:hypothetical protein
VSCVLNFVAMPYDADHTKRTHCGVKLRLGLF